MPIVDNVLRMGGCSPPKRRRDHEQHNAWPAHDLATVEQLTAEGFHFTSPVDNRLDRATFLERCWPNNANKKTLEIQSAVGDGDKVFVVYEPGQHDGKRFRNAEVVSIISGKLTEVEKLSTCSN